MKPINPGSWMTPTLDSGPANMNAWLLIPLHHIVTYAIQAQKHGRFLTTILLIVIGSHQDHPYVDYAIGDMQTMTSRSNGLQDLPARKAGSFQFAIESPP